MSAKLSRSRGDSRPGDPRARTIPCAGFARLLVVALPCTASVCGAQTVIDFDSMQGQSPPGGPVAPQFLVHDQFLSLGVRFDSAGGGIAVNAPGNPVSPPNTCTATMINGGGPYVSYTDDVTATFWVGSTAAVVDYVSVALSNSTSPSSLEAFDSNGVSLGASNGGASAVLLVSFPGQIHTVVIHQGPMAFDDFTFDGLSTGISPMCFGDGTQATPCPCGNSGLSHHGCDNSTASGGAFLSANGTTSPDTLVLTSSGEPPTAPSIFLQGTTTIAPVVFGDGLRCVHGILKRLYVKPAVSGVVSAPLAGDPSISAQSAALGDPIAPGSMRYYQVYYRDPNPSYCPAPTGNTWNVSSGGQVQW